MCSSNDVLVVLLLLPSYIFFTHHNTNRSPANCVPSATEIKSNSFVDDPCPPAPLPSRSFGQRLASTYNLINFKLQRIKCSQLRIPGPSSGICVPPTPSNSTDCLPIELFYLLVSGINCSPPFERWKLKIFSHVLELHTCSRNGKRISPAPRLHHCPSRSHCLHNEISAHKNQKWSAEKGKKTNLLVKKDPFEPKLWELVESLVSHDPAAG